MKHVMVLREDLDELRMYLEEAEQSGNRETKDRALVAAHVLVRLWLKDKAKAGKRPRVRKPEAPRPKAAAPEPPPAAPAPIPAPVTAEEEAPSRGIVSGLKAAPAGGR